MDEAHHLRKIEITIFQKKNLGAASVEYIQQCLYAYPQISPIFYVFHKLLKSFKLHQGSKAGLKPYAVFLMILKFIENSQANTMTELFMKFVEYYAYSEFYE